MAAIKRRGRGWHSLGRSLHGASYHLRIMPADGEPTDLPGARPLQSRPPDPGAAAPRHPADVPLSYGDQIYAGETPGPAIRPCTRDRGRPP